MKNSLILCAIVVLIGCKRDVDPGPITRIEYSNTIGFTGSTSTVVIDPQKEVLDYRGKVKKCERLITLTEWNNLVEGFNWKEFSEAKSNTEPVCCDIGGGSIKVTAGSKSHEVSWTLYLPKGVQQDFAGKLSERWGNLTRNCP